MKGPPAIPTRRRTSPTRSLCQADGTFNGCQMRVVSSAAPWIMHGPNRRRSRFGALLSFYDRAA
jgi:hypothetical protein